jgi:hypothetical protein
MTISADFSNVTALHTAISKRANVPFNKSLLGTGIEPVTYCVLSSRHNQLDHPSFLIFDVH